MSENAVREARLLMPVSEEAILQNYNRIKLSTHNGIYDEIPTLQVIMPRSATEGSAGYDVFNNVGEDLILYPHKKVFFWTNVKAYFERGLVLLAFPRSSYGTKKDIVLANTIGVIDADYCNNPNNEGNIGICLKNTGDKEVIIPSGEAVCQLILLPFIKFDNCNSNDPRLSGFGSTTVSF